MKAIVVGGGVGGLTAALCLRHHGVDVEVLEQSAALEDVGAGLQLSPNAMRVLQALGLEAALQAVAVRPEAIELRMGESGLSLIRSALGDVAERRWGAPYLHIHRADLVQLLKRALAERAPAALRLNAKLAAYEQSATGATARLSEGGEIDADVLIGADGVHSAIRTQMLGPDQPRFTGHVAWRAVAPVDRLGAPAPAPAATAWMGRGKHAVTYLVRQGALANVVGVVEQDDWSEESWSARGRREDALADFAGWRPEVTRILEHADELYLWALLDRAPLKRWTDGRIALLGDAAHPMTPFMAQGAAAAIEDAWALAARLADADDPASALKSYETLRLPRASKLQAASSANAPLFHRRTAMGRMTSYGPMWLAGRLAPFAGRMRQDWVYRYDVIDATKR